MYTKDKEVRISQDEKPHSISSSNSNTSLEHLPSTQRKPLNGKIFTFYSGSSFPWTDMKILEDNDRVAYYAEVSEFTRNKPDIILHRGARSGSVCAHSFFGWFTRSFKCGMGPDETSMQWVEFKKGSFGKRRFEFHWDGRTYVLQAATSAETNVSGAARLMLTHFKIIDAESGEMIALYVSEKIGGKKGTLSLKASLCGDLELLCVLGVASWRDKIRRRQPKGGGAGVDG